ncbi:MAG TPA: ATP synthase subunit I [Acidimicrobiales bacterium]|nr:ATP synthase subunit I [Acidimicrobiales bacterium]
MTSSVLTPDTAAPEADVARDLLRRMAWVAPLFVVGGLVGWGVDGALSSLVALALVGANFAAAAALLGWGARNGQTTLLLAVMGGYVVRLGAVLAVLWLIQDLDWVEMAPLAITLLTTHLGLLIWETKYVSLSLAYPGLKPGTNTEGSD